MIRTADQYQNNMRHDEIVPPGGRETGLRYQYQQGAQRDTANCVDRHENGHRVSRFAVAQEVCQPDVSCFQFSSAFAQIQKLRNETRWTKLLLVLLLLFTLKRVEVLYVHYNIQIRK